MTPPKTTPEPITELDLVDRIFAYLEAELLDITRGVSEIERVKAEVRAEFGGSDCYIARMPRTDRAKRVREVMRLFNGRNAADVARQLKISRTTVYRILKQPGQQ